MLQCFALSNRKEINGGKALSSKAYNKLPGVGKLIYYIENCSDFYGIGQQLLMSETYIMSQNLRSDRYVIAKFDVKVRNEQFINISYIIKQ